MAAEKHEKGNDQPLVEQVTEFLQLQLAATKLTAIELLSLTLSYGFGVLLAIGAAMLALMFFLGAITLLIAQAIGSLEWAMIIAAIVFAIVGIVAYCLREQMITDTLVRRFAQMFFATDNEQNNDAQND
jgi:hypothetical protein